MRDGDEPGGHMTMVAPVGAPVSDESNDRRDTDERPLDALIDQRVKTEDWRYSCGQREQRAMNRQNTSPRAIDGFRPLSAVCAP